MFISMRLSDYKIWLRHCLICLASTKLKLNKLGNFKQKNVGLNFKTAQRKHLKALVLDNQKTLRHGPPCTGRPCTLMQTYQMWEGFINPCLLYTSHLFSSCYQNNSLLYFLYFEHFTHFSLACLYSVSWFQLPAMTKCGMRHFPNVFCLSPRISFWEFNFFTYAASII